MAQTGNTSLIVPKDSLYVSDTFVAFHWNVVQGGSITYDLQVDDDPAFGSPLLNVQGLTTNKDTLLNPTANTWFYWRVRAVDGATPGSWTPAWHFRTFQPADLSNLDYWFRADKGIVLNGGFVETWEDQSGNNRDATQATAARRPAYISSDAAVNDRPVVAFDGLVSGTLSDYMQITSAGTLSEVYFVVNWSGPEDTFPQFNGLFSKTNQADNTHALAFVNRATTNFFEGGAFPFFGGTEINGVSTLDLGPNINDYSVVRKLDPNGLSYGASAADNIHFATNRLRDDRYWKGNFAEMVNFSVPLSAGGSADMLNYFFDRYGKKANLGEDIYKNYSLCVDTLSPGMGFNSYAWSTGESTPTIVVTESGTYSVTVTDQFGVESADTLILENTVTVTLPDDTAFCSGEVLMLSTGLSGSYTYLWSEGTTTDVITITAGGDYWLTVTDDSSCSLVTDTVTVMEDSFADSVSLGNDTSLCSGNVIGLVAGLQPGLSYLWSTNDTSPTIAITATGDYSVEVTTNSGCVGRDTINVIISGTAPDTDFSADTVCYGLPTTFTDMSTVVGGATIVSWFWDFGTGNPGDTSNMEDPVFPYASPGVYTVTLATTSNAGCSKAYSTDILVNENPVAAFSDSVTCIGLNYQFTDESIPPAGGNIVNWGWAFGDASQSSAQNPFHVYSAANTYNVTLEVTADNTCKDTFTAPFLVAPVQPPPTQPVLVSPQDSLLSGSSNLLLVWNPDSSAASYTIEIDDDPNFGSPNFTQDGITGSSYSLATAGLPSTFYWRVVASNLCGDEVESASRTVILFAPGLIGGMDLWLKADEGVSLDGNNKVESWADYSGANKTVGQVNSANRPTTVQTVCQLNNKPVVYFDGVDDFLEVDTSGDARHMYIVANYEGGGTTFNAFIGLVTKPQPADLSAVYFLTDRFNSNWFAGGTVYGSDIDINEVSTLNFAPLEKYKIIDGSSNGANTTYPDGLVIGRDGRVANLDRFWKGGVAELITFNKVLTAQEEALVIQYLRDKYAPPVSLGPDIVVDYGLCDTLTTNANCYTSYNWSNTDTTPFLYLTESGTHAVTVIDEFGYQSADTVDIQFPTYIDLGMDTICFGEDTSYTVGLGANYNYQWSHGPATETVVLDVEDTYRVTITDNNGCSVESNTLTLDVDSFSLIATLGADDSICSGNEIGLVAGAASAVNYLWSTNDTTPTLVVNTSGNYSLTVDNFAGCQAIDTITVVVTGTAPVADFTSNVVCAGTPTSFTDLSTATLPSVITQWDWDFGTGTSNQQNPTFIFPSNGIYNVTLTVTTDADCDRTTVKQVFVDENPQALFYDSLACEGYSYRFMDASTTGTGSINSWNWDFDDTNTSMVQNPNHTYSVTGTYNVSLTVTATNGCADTFVQPFNVIPVQPTPNAPDLVSPANGFVTGAGSITLLWNADPTVAAYTVEIDDDPNFSPPIISQDASGSSSYVLSTAGLPGTIYWRIVAGNACGDITPSPVRTITIFSPALISNMDLWLKADAGVSLDGSNFVQSWMDFSGTSKSALQNTATNRPTVRTECELNNMPVVYFDGMNDFLDVTGSGDAKQMFVVANYNSTDTVFNAYKGLITKPSSAQPNPIYLIGDVNKPDLYASGNYAGNIKVNDVPTQNFAPLNQYKIISAFRNSAVTTYNAGLVIGWDRKTNLDRFWLGGVAEIITYSKVLTTQEEALVIKYLRDKYAPPVNLGQDTLIAYGFCPIELETDSCKASYLWSTGSDSTIAEVTKPGEYAVTVTDYFGYTSADTVRVIYPGTNFPDEIPLCLGDQLVLSTGLDTAGYDFVWSTGSMDDTIIVSTEQYVGLMVADTISPVNCSINYDSIFVNVDSFSIQATLGPDTSICSGDSITLVVGAEQAASYLWTDFSTDSFLTITRPGGSYGVTVTNVNGCEVQDMINLSIRGDLPEADFTATAACLGDSTQFIDVSIPVAPDMVSGWLWQFGENGATDTTETPKYQYGAVGDYNVTLSVTTDANCTSTVTKTTTVKELPTASFINTTPCAQSGVLFTDLSQPPPNGDPLVAWDWDFGDNTANGSGNFVSHTYAAPGKYGVTLTATTLGGCSNSVTDTIEVFPAIGVDIGTANLCFGETVQFADSSNSFSITSWFWDFGDQTNPSFVQNPTHSYNSPGTYTVSLSVENALGCERTITESVTIFPAPTANFLGEDVCIGDISAFVDASTAPSGDTVDTWLWDFGDSTANSVVQNPFHRYDTTGTFDVTLTVTTTQGCSNTTIIPVTVASPPVAGFTFSPDFGPAPLTVNFSDQSVSAADYLWVFGDGDSSTSMNPTHTYQANGSYNIILEVTSLEGCSDTAMSQLDVNDASLDLAVENMQVMQEIQSNGLCKLTVTAIVRNMGARGIKTFDILAQVGDGPAIGENWEGASALLTGNGIAYTFTSSFYIDCDNRDYICVETAMPNGEADENPLNDRLCENLEGDNIQISLPYPNPAGDYVALDVVLARANNLEVELYDALGKELWEVYNGEANEGLNNFTLDMRAFASGNYIFIIRYQDEEYSVKFVHE